MISPLATRFWSSAKLCISRATEKSSVVWASPGASSPRTSAAPAIVATSLKLWENVTLLLPGDAPDCIGCPAADRANSITICAVCNASVQAFFRLGQVLLPDAVCVLSIVNLRNRSYCFLCALLERVCNSAILHPLRYLQGNL